MAEGFGEADFFGAGEAEAAFFEVAAAEVARLGDAFSAEAVAAAVVVVVGGGGLLEREDFARGAGDFDPFGGIELMQKKKNRFFFFF